MRRLLTAIALGGFAALASGCGDDGMSMSNDVDTLSNHQGALETELGDHHLTVLSMSDVPGMRTVERGFVSAALGHLDEMDHVMRDMRDMCRMGGRGFDPGAMTDTMGRARAGLDEHRRRMAALDDLNALHTEEGAFRDSMAGLMGEMRGHESDMRAVAMHYSCRMHGH